MFKLKKRPQNDINKFIGVSFIYDEDKYEITSIDKDGDGELCFYLDGKSGRRVSIKNFHKNIEVGRFKLCKDVGV